MFVDDMRDRFTRRQSVLYRCVHASTLLKGFFRPFVFRRMPTGRCPADRICLGRIRLYSVCLNLCNDLCKCRSTSNISPARQRCSLTTRLRGDHLVCVGDVSRKDERPGRVTLVGGMRHSVIHEAFISLSKLQASICTSLVHCLRRGNFVE